MGKIKVVLWDIDGTLLSFRKAERGGDSLTSDMQGGVNAGIKTCWYNPEGSENTSALFLDYEIHHLDEVLQVAG